MGCDIHLHVESKEKSKWQILDAPEEFDKDWYPGRNYTEFSVLADVRNGYGCAGCDTGDRIQPISSPKGLPSDVSRTVKASSDRWDGDGHSHSWLTLKELLDYNWDATLVSRGYVNVRGFQHFLEKGKPETWSGLVGGHQVVHLTPEQMKAALDAAGNDPDKITPDLIRGLGVELPDGIPQVSVYTQVQWTEPLRNRCYWLVEKIIPYLKERYGDNPEAVRLVFWFDN